MKKIKYFICILFFIPIILSAQTLIETPQQKDNLNHSKQLIERYNKLRIKRVLSNIQHDTILDNITMEIQSNRKYRKSMNLFNEDSIRLLLHKKGITDYQYEIKEVLDKDTASSYKSFLLNDLFVNLRVGICKKNNRTILFKTKSFLKFDHWEEYVHSPKIDGLHYKSKTIRVDIKTDSIKCYMKTLIQGKYTFYTSDLIPSKSDRISIMTKKPSIIKQNNKSLKKPYDLVFTLKDKECNKYLIVVNENYEKIAILK